MVLKMKFEEAYSISHHSNYTIEEIAKIHEKSLETYVTDYKGYFACPECREAKLNFVNSKPCYFRTEQDDSHNDDCSLKQLTMSAHQTEGFVSNTENKEKIGRQLQSIMTMLLSDKPTAVRTTRVQSNATSSKKQSSSVSESFREKQVPRKRIDTKFRNEDYDCYKFFYGKVRAVWEKDEKRPEYMKLLLFHAKESRLLCRIYITGKVFSHIPQPYKDLNQKVCEIAFLASFDSNRNSTEKSYQSTSLRFGHFFILNHP